MTVDIPINALTEDEKPAMNKDADLQILKQYIVRGWLHTKDEVEPGVERSWLIRHKLIIINGVAMEGK